MQAIRYDRTGSADVLELVEMDAPVPGAGEVRVRVHVSGVNPTDHKSRAGATGRPLPASFQIPNQDGAGVVDAVGDGVARDRVGERVWVYFAAWQRPWGTAAQWTVVPADQAVALPSEVSFDLGASLGIPALTAHRCLFADGPVDDRTVLVAGGAGAVGHAAIQLARWAGAHVIATVSSPQKAQLARNAGAHRVVNYRDHDALGQVRAAAPDGVDRVVEVAPATNLDLDLAVIGANSAIASYATSGGDEAIVPIRRCMGANTTLRFVLVYTMPADAVRSAVADVTDAVREGALTNLPLHRFPLSQAADAHRAVEESAVGKVVIDVP